MSKTTILLKRCAALLKRCAAGWGAAVGLMLANSAGAVTDNVIAEVTFATAITVTENNTLKYGVLDVNLAITEEVIVATNDGVTDLSSRVMGGTQEAGQLTVVAQPGQPINILVDTIVTSAGYDLDTFQCDYNAGATAGPCSAAALAVAVPIASAVVLVGATLTGNAGTPVAGIQNGSFNFTVLYQ